MAVIVSRSCGVAALGWLALTSCSPAPLDAIELVPTTLTDAVVVHWTFDEGTGTVVLDHSGNGHTGQITGGTWIADGRFGGALHLAAGEFVSAASFPDATASWSVSAWVRLTDSTPTTETYKSVISTESPGAGGWEMNIDRSQAQPGAHFGFWKGPAAGDYYGVQCYCVAFQQWTHIVGMVDSAALTVAVYVNGALGEAMALTQTITPGTPAVYVGKWGGSGRLLVGDVDDIVIYGRALTTHEIIQLGQESPPDPR
jgi:hypothetical protein